MIRYIHHSQINKKDWDSCIGNSANTTIYAYSWYLDAVCPAWEALVEGEYETVMPLTPNKKYSIHYLFQPFFTQQLGVFSNYLRTESKINQFLSAIPEKFKFVEIN